MLQHLPPEIKIDENSSKHLQRAFLKYTTLLQDLETRPLSPKTIQALNLNTQHIINNSAHTRSLAKALRTSLRKSLRILEREYKLVEPTHYQNLWMVLGMVIFGPTFGTVFASNNVSMLGVGFPIGMAIGMAIGSGLDKKALKDGRQLKIQSKLTKSK